MESLGVVIFTPLLDTCSRRPWDALQGANSDRDGSSEASPIRANFSVRESVLYFQYHFRWDRGGIKTQEIHRGMPGDAGEGGQRTHQMGTSSAEHDLGKVTVGELCIAIEINRRGWRSVRRNSASCMEDPSVARR
nr:hypothetical protein CFP56_65176 [Quercus suber]